MSIRFVCPLGHELEEPDDRAGTESRCPVCQQRLFVPEISQTATPPPRDPVGAPRVEAAPGELLPATTVVTPPLPSESSLAVAEPTPTDNAAISPEAVRWLAWRRSDALTGYAIMRPTARQLEVVYWLACSLPFAAAFCAAPALPHLYFSGAPLWAQWMLVTAMLELAYAAWLGLLPDRSTVCVGMYLMTATATGYLIAFVVICFSSETQLAALDMSGRLGAAAWCLLALVISATTSAACGWVVRQWDDRTAVEH